MDGWMDGWALENSGLLTRSNKECHIRRSAISRSDSTGRFGMIPFNAPNDVSLTACVIWWKHRPRFCIFFVSFTYYPLDCFTFESTT
jgi:hypothetical protein